MGVGTTVSADKCLQILTAEICPASHPIWQSVSLSVFSDSAVFRPVILLIKEKRPENIPELIRFSISYFFRASSDLSLSRFHIFTFCEFFSLLIAVTALQNSSAWLTASPFHLIAPIPAVSLLQALNRFLRLDQGVSYSFKTRLSCLKTLLFAIHSGPPEFLQSCDGLPGTAFLGASLRAVASALTDRSKYAVRFVRSLLSFVIPCVHGCRSWDLQSVDIADIDGALSPLFQLTNPAVESALADRLVQCSDELVSLLVVVLLKRPQYLDFLAQRVLVMRCAAGLLYLFRERAGAGRSFAVDVILHVLGIIAAHEQAPSQWRGPFAGVLVGTHARSFADVAVECLTDPVLVRGSDPLVIESVAGICGLGVTLGSFAAGQLLLLLKKMWIAKDVAMAERFAGGICELMAGGLAGNVPLLAFCGDYRKVLKEMDGAGVVAARWIVKTVGATEADLLVLDEQERTARLSTRTCGESPSPRKPRPFEMTSEIESRWLEWLRELFWNLLPELSIKVSQVEAPTAGSWWFF
jgi:hypothetical protein